MQQLAAKADTFSYIYLFLILVVFSWRSTQILNSNIWFSCAKQTYKGELSAFVCIPDIVIASSWLIYADSLEILFCWGGTLIKLCNVYQFSRKISFCQDFQKILLFPACLCCLITPYLSFVSNVWVRLPLCCCYYCLDIHWKLLI